MLRNGSRLRHKGSSSLIFLCNKKMEKNRLQETLFQNRLSFSIATVSPVPKDIAIQFKMFSTDCQRAQAARETQSLKKKKKSWKVLVNLEKNLSVELTLMTEPSSPWGWLIESAGHLRSILTLQLLQVFDSLGHRASQNTGHSYNTEQAAVSSVVSTPPFLPARRTWLPLRAPLECKLQN